MTSAPITLEVTDDVARIALARPDRGNAIDLELAHALLATIEKLDTGLGAVVLSGEGDSFCVGGDLRAFAAAPAPGTMIAELAATTHAAILALRALDAPVITAIKGACAGGGIGLALAGDLVLAAPSTRFRVAYTAASLSPDCGVSWILTRTLGAARAADLILTNRPFDAAEAERYGLVSRVTGDDVVTEAFALAAKLATGPRAALAQSARLIRDAASTSLVHHLDAEARGIAALADTPEGQEGISAFLEKRRPDFAVARGKRLGS